MNEVRKTLLFAGTAVVLALLAWVTAPAKPTPEAFFDRGETFFPDFVDPNVATTLQVIEFDEDTASALPFKVTFDGTRWTIPSHHDYPADGEERLVQTSSGVIDIKKDDFSTDNIADHEACGVIDPLDDAATALTGRGKRVTIKGSANDTLADLIIGREPEGRPEYRFVRVPGQKRVYVSKIAADISARFADWIEKDLLKLEPDSIVEIVLEDYRIDERTRRVQRNDTVRLSKSGTNWQLDRVPAGQTLDTTKVSQLVKAIDELNIVGVRPKPPGLSAGLASAAGMQVSNADLSSLQQKGYYLTRDGTLMSNEGEVRVTTLDGIRYTLRFGEILYGRGDAITAGAESTADTASGPGENRYLFITAELDGSRLPEPPRPANRDFDAKAETEWSDDDRRNRQLALAWDAWQAQITTAQQRAAELRNRFAGWYYVISASSFDQVRLDRGKLVKTAS